MTVAHETDVDPKVTNNIQTKEMWLILLLFVDLWPQLRVTYFNLGYLLIKLFINYLDWSSTRRKSPNQKSASKLARWGNAAGLFRSALYCHLLAVARTLSAFMSVFRFVKLSLSCNQVLQHVRYQLYLMLPSDIFNVILLLCFLSSPLQEFKLEVFSISTKTTNMNK